MFYERRNRAGIYKLCIKYTDYDVFTVHFFLSVIKNVLSKDIIVDKASQFAALNYKFSDQFESRDIHAVKMVSNVLYG